MPTAESIKARIDDEAHPDRMSPVEAWNFYKEIEEHCSSAADALREENPDEDFV